MKKVFSYISLFICTFMLFGSILTVHAAEEYDVYETGEKITKQMTSGKEVDFTVVEDEGINSKYVKVIANPADLGQFIDNPAYSYNDLATAIANGEWTNKQLAITDGLGKLWRPSKSIRIEPGTDYKVEIFTKKNYDYFKDLLSKKNSDVDAAIAEAFKGQTFWVINQDETNALKYDRILNGVYTETEMDDTAKANAINLTVQVTICKEPKKICKYDSTTKKYYGSKGQEVTAAEYQKQCGNPDTADNNVIVLSIIAAGCVLCIIGFGKKILAK